MGEVLILLRHCWRDAFFCVCVGSGSFCHDWASHCSVWFWSLDALSVFGLPLRPPRLLTRQLCGSVCVVFSSGVFGPWTVNSFVQILERGVAVVCFEVTIGESLYRFCLRLVIWLGDPWFPHGAVLLLSPAGMALCFLVFSPFICLRPYHDEMTQCCHLLHESANELVASHSSFVGCSCLVFVLFWLFVFALFVLLLRMAAHRATGPSPVLFCGPPSADGLAC